MNSKRFTLSIFIVVCFMLTTCGKKVSLGPEEPKCEIPDQNCPKGSLVVGNKTNDTIHFNRGEGGTNVKYYLSVPPAGTKVIETNGVSVTFDGDCSVTRFSGPIEGIQIPGQYFSVKMNRCTKQVYFVRIGNKVDLEIIDPD